jgi:hypothetical protein
MENIIIEVPITYNWQVNNFNFNNKFKGSAQCGPTSCSQMLSAFIKEASSDTFVKEFVEKIDGDWLSGKVQTRQSAFQFNYKGTIDYFLKKYNINKQAIVLQSGGTINDVIKALQLGSPLMCSTMLTGEGHYITINGIDTSKNVFKVKDPFGLFDFKTKRYIKVIDGAGDTEYPINDLTPYLEKSSMTATKKGGFRFIWIG